MRNHVGKGRRGLLVVMGLAAGGLATAIAPAVPALASGQVCAGIVIDDGIGRSTGVPGCLSPSGFERSGPPERGRRHVHAEQFRSDMRHQQLSAQWPTKLPQRRTRPLLLLVVLGGRPHDQHLDLRQCRTGGAHRDGRAVVRRGLALPRPRPRFPRRDQAVGEARRGIRPGLFRRVLVATAERRRHGYSGGGSGGAVTTTTGAPATSPATSAARDRLERAGSRR